MNEKIKQAQETLLKLSGLALKYLVDNFHYDNKEYHKLKKEIGNLTDKLRLTLNDFDRYHESQQDLIKGKDEHIAKLCNDRAELKEENKNLKTENDRYSEYQENLEIRMVNDGFVIDILKEFAKSIFKYCLNYQELLVNMLWGNDSDDERYKQFIKIHIGEKAEDMTFGEWKAIKKVVEKYGK